MFRRLLKYFLPENFSNKTLRSQSLLSFSFYLIVLCLLFAYFLLIILDETFEILNVIGFLLLTLLFLICVAVIKCFSKSTIVLSSLYICTFSIIFMEINRKNEFFLGWILGICTTTMVQLTGDWKSTFLTIGLNIYFLIRIDSQELRVFSYFSLIYVVDLSILTYLGKLNEKKFFAEMTNREQNIILLKKLILEETKNNWILIQRKGTIPKRKKASLNQLNKEVVPMSKQFSKKFEKLNDFNFSSKSKNKRFSFTKLSDFIEFFSKCTKKMMFAQNDTDIFPSDMPKNHSEWKKDKFNDKLNGVKLARYSFKLERKDSVFFRISEISHSRLRNNISPPYSAKHHLETESNIFKDKMLSSICHDLRSPINGLLHFIKSAQETDDEEIRSRYFEFAIVNTNLLFNMVNDILDLTLLSQGLLKLNKERFPLKSVIEEVIELMRLQAMSKGIELLIDNIMPGLLLYSDSRRIKQVLINIIGNAIKFTFAGFVKLKVRKINSGNLIKIEVSDTGVGIEANLLKGISKPFVSNGDLRVNPNGIGLGLYYSKLIIGHLGPYKGIFIYSEEGKGTKFGFLLNTSLEEKISLQSIDDYFSNELDKEERKINDNDAIYYQNVRGNQFMPDREIRNYFKRRTFVESQVNFRKRNKIRFLTLDPTSSKVN